MKDLYHRLQLDEQVDDPESLRISIRRCPDAETREAASYVLLNPERKAVYDSNHQILMRIGHLRRELSLPTSPQWDLLENDDFDREFTDRREPLLKWLGVDGSLQAIRAGWKRSVAGAKYRVALAIGGALSLTLCGFMYVLILINSTDRNLSVDSTTIEVASAMSATSNLNPAADAESTHDTDPDESRPQRQLMRRALPKNGTVTRYHSSKEVVTFKIEAQQGKGHYFVKLVNLESGETALTVFVRDGQQVEFGVPAGIYELHYALGTTWYGSEHVFGEDKQFARAKDSFDCRVNRNRLTVYTVRLSTKSMVEGAASRKSSGEF